ncbi:MAG: hypothetical protein KAH20_02330 [Methylococcales bacterium]|nr:hypothetical protein [Methylococcales bacterium]
MNQKENEVSGISSTLLSEGKSTRLMEMRKKAASVIAPAEDQLAVSMPMSDTLDTPTKEALLKARQMIDQQLIHILGKYPANKHAKFFKIRFNMDIDQLKKLSIKDIYSVINIKQNKQSSLDQVTGLDYFGRFLSK